MAGKPRKDANRVTESGLLEGASGGGVSRHVTEISAERAAERVERAWMALGEQWYIPYAPDRSFKHLDETFESRDTVTAARHAFFEFMGDELSAAVRRSETTVTIAWTDADAYVRKRTRKTLSERNFTKALSLWRKGEAGSENATPLPVTNGRLQIPHEGRAEREEIEIIPPRRAKLSMTAKVVVRLFDDAGNACAVKGPPRAAAPVAEAGPRDDAARVRKIEDESSADRLRAEARTLDRRGHRTLANELRTIAQRLRRHAGRHPIVACIVLVLVLSGSAYAAVPAFRRGVHRTATAIRHLFVKRQLFMLHDFVRLIRTSGTIVAREDDEVVRLTARPLAPNLRGNQVFTVWMRYDIVPPTLIHRPSEDQYVGAEWEIPVYDIDDQGIVVMVMLADTRDVHDPARQVRDEEVQLDYVGLRMRNDRVEVFDPDSLVPPPRPPKDRRWLPALQLTIPTK